MGNPNPISQGLASYPLAFLARVRDKVLIGFPKTIMEA